MGPVHYIMSSHLQLNDIYFFSCFSSLYKCSEIYFLTKELVHSSSCVSGGHRKLFLENTATVGSYRCVTVCASSLWILF